MVASEFGPPLCSICRRNPGTVTWGDALATTHGFATKVCQPCATLAQLTHIAERMAAVDDLIAELNACCTCGVVPTMADGEAIVAAFTMEHRRGCPLAHLCPRDDLREAL